MLCFLREERQFLHFSPVNFQVLHRNWTNINSASISSGTSPEVGILVELKIAIINKKFVSLPPHCALRVSLETAQYCRGTWLWKAKLIRNRSFVLSQGWRGRTGRGWRQLQDFPGTTQEVICFSAAPNPCSSASAKRQVSSTMQQFTLPRLLPSSSLRHRHVSKEKDASTTMKMRSHQVLLTLNG